MGLFDDIDPQLEKAVNKGVGYLSHRERSIWEMRSYLKKKEFSPAVTTQAVDKLKGWGYLDDHRFAKLFIKSRMSSNPKSTFALGCELKAKGISQEIIDDLTTELDNSDMAYESAMKKWNRWRRLDRESIKKKLMSHLRYRGFGYADSIQAWERISQELLDGD